MLKGVLKSRKPLFNEIARGFRPLALALGYATAPLDSQYLFNPKHSSIDSVQLRNEQSPSVGPVE